MTQDDVPTTGILAGDRSALDRLIPMVYDELRALARRQLGREMGPRSIQPTTLVHEAYVKLSRNVPQSVDRAHLLALASHVMRQVLIDRARERRALKRGGDLQRIELTDGIGAHGGLDHMALLTLNDAIEQLEPRQRQVVECRFFGGLEEQEIADALGVTVRTVQRDWVKARAWLGRALQEGEGA